MSVQDLMAVEVSSVSRKDQKLSDAAAAIFVITQEDIRRSGSTTIPELLRMVPGLEVAHIDSNKWAISSRGFNGRFANKLLVLLDGRSVYTPLYSGVFWDIQDTMLEDIERIEVIRGPGATLWGANAVNGIINIITKKAGETQGGLVTGGFGTEERGFGAVRYGSKVGDEAFWRAYTKVFNRDSAVYPSGKDAADEWEAFRAGGRMDWQPSLGDTLTFQGDFYKENAGQSLQVPLLTNPFLAKRNETNNLEGGNLLTKWEHTLSPSSSTRLQVYYDHTGFEGSLLGEKRDTVDIDFQHRFKTLERHDFVWGLGYRFSEDWVHNTFTTQIIPAGECTHLFSGFLQDDISLIQERLHFILGSKIEHNDYSGFEIQPNARLVWTPHAEHTLWAAVSRAVRTPSQTEEGSRLNVSVLPPHSPDNPFSIPGLVSIFGNGGFLSEELIAYELGYRIQPMRDLSFDLALFYNDYDDLRTVTRGDPYLEQSGPPHFVIPLRFTNRMYGEVYGAELAADWTPLKWWRFKAAYTFLQMDLHTRSDLNDPSQESPEGQSPHHQISLRSQMDLPGHFEFDTWLRYVDDLPTIGVGSNINLDLRLGWKLLKNLELSIVGQNLLQPHHAEFALEPIDPTVRTDVQRSVYGKVTWRF